MRIAKHENAAKPVGGFLLPKKVEVRNAVLVAVLLIATALARADEAAAEQSEEATSTLWCS